MTNDAKGKRLQTPDEITIHLVDVKAGRRRMRRVGNQFRAEIGIVNLVDPSLIAIDINEVEAVEVLAPYAPPTPRLATVLVGAAIAFLLGGGTSFETGAMLAITTGAFAMVATIVAQSTPARQRIARLRMAEGAIHCITYQLQEETGVQAAFQGARWRNDADQPNATILKKEEERRLEQLRIGIVMMASAVAIMVLFTTADRSHFGLTVDTPYDILHTATWIIVIAINVIAWYKMLRAKFESIAANREGARP